MIRHDSAGGTQGFLDWLTAKRRNFFYSVDRLRGRCEDRIRNAKDTGLANLPPRLRPAMSCRAIWSWLAAEIMAWTQMVAFTGTKARRWEPKETSGQTV